MVTQDFSLYLFKYSMTLWSPVVTVCTTGLDIYKFYTPSIQFIYVVYIDLTTRFPNRALNDRIL